MGTAYAVQVYKCTCCLLFIILWLKRRVKARDTSYYTSSNLYGHKFSILFILIREKDAVVFLKFLLDYHFSYTKGVSVFYHKLLIFCEAIMLNFVFNSKTMFL